MSTKRVNDIRDLRPTTAEKTGVYIDKLGSGDSRYFKAGEQITRNYTFSHKRGETPAAARKAA